MKATRLLRCALLAGAAVLLLSCGDRTALGPHAPAPPSLLLDSVIQNLGLVQCTPLAADSATATIGPEGGVLNVGPHTLTVPAGALDSTVTITAVAPSDTVNRVHFEPQGLTFQQPAQLTVSYANCNVLGVQLPKQIVYVDDLLLILEYLPSLDDLSGQTVTGQVSHFSDYALAW